MDNTDSVPWGSARSFGLADICVEAAKRRFIRGGISRFLLNKFATGDDFRDIVADGLRVRCHYGDNHSERKLFLVGGAKQAEEIAMLMALMKSGDTFIDVGANCGWFTLNAARHVGPSGRVIAIEPQPTMMSRLLANVALNGFENVTPVRAALASTAGWITMHVNTKQRGLSGVDEACGDSCIHVETIPISDILVDVPGNVVLKIDVEGFEDHALNPLRHMPYDQLPKAIFMETRHSDRWETDILLDLIDAGYRVEWAKRGDALLVLS